MRPAVEKRVLRELDEAEGELRALRELMLVTFARDDEPIERDARDAVSRRAHRVVKNTLAVTKGLRKTVDVAKGLSEFES